MRRWIADAYRGDGKSFVVRADEKLTAFMELESAINQSKLLADWALLWTVKSYRDIGHFGF